MLERIQIWYVQANSLSLGRQPEQEAQELKEEKSLDVLMGKLPVDKKQNKKANY